MPESIPLTSANIPNLYTGDEATVLLVLQSLLDFVSHRDISRISHTYFPSGGSARWRPTGMLFGSIGDMVTVISKLEVEAEEYMWGPEFKFWGNMCMVWVNCKVKIGEREYCAKNNISFHKVEEEGWKISGIMDTISQGLSDARG